ncbi:MAG: methylthioribulose 1-phosphate dehydratase [Janthinobacterium lividum]
MNEAAHAVSQPRSTSDEAWAAAVDEIVAAGRRMDRHGWVPATAGNISRRLADGRIAITRSGCHKGFLTTRDVIEVDLDGRPATIGDRPSAETRLHTDLYRRLLPDGAVIHGHSIAATVLSMHEPDRRPSDGSWDAIEFSGYELLKAFEGQGTHQTSLRLPIYDNDQDIARLAELISPKLGACPMGYLIRGHGVYVWGRTMDMALARLEGLEFLLACVLERRKLDLRP